MRRKIYATIFFLSVPFCLFKHLFGFENKNTHPVLTDKAVAASVIDNYLKTQPGFKDGVQTTLEWDFSFYLHVKKPIEAGENDQSKTTRI